MILKIINWKAISKFCVTIICGLHFDRPSRISCEKYDERCYDQSWTFKGMKNFGKVKTVTITKGPFNFIKLLD